VPSPQKAKGSSWEREVARQLSSIYNESFIRAPGSGAYVGGTNSTRKEFLHEGQIRALKGDIIPGPSFVHFNAECKSYAEMPWHQLYTGDCKLLDGWITQCLDAEDEGDINLLFMKFNRKGTFLAFQQRHKAHFKLENYTCYSPLSESLAGPWVVTDLGSFLGIRHNQTKLKELCS
jgi:hypothetical protein